MGRRRRWDEGEVGDGTKSYAKLMQPQPRKRIVAPQGEVKEQEEEGSMLWMRGLPHDLLVRILAFLPVHKLLHFQTVCKSWRSLYQCPQLSSEFAPRETWLVMQRNWCSFEPEHIAFCLTLNRWCRLPTSFTWPGDSTSFTCSENSFLASAGGLIVLCTPGHLVVLNVLTKASKAIFNPALPQEFRARGCLLPTMLANRVDGSYQIFLASSEMPWLGVPEGAHIKVYDSRTQSWELRFRHANRQALVYDSESQSWKWKAPPVYDSESQSWKWKAPRCSAGSSRNVLDDDLFVLDKEKGELLTYNAERYMSSTLKTPVPSCTSKGGGRLNLALHNVVKCKGRVLMVGALELSEGGSRTIEGLGVWEWKPVGQGTGTWVELARTQPEYWEPYWPQCPDAYWEWCRFHCDVVDDNLICITALEILDVSSGNYWPPLAYDLDRGSWQRLPFYGDKADCLGSFTYEPSWTAVP